MSTPAFVEPLEDVDSAPFWAGLDEHELLVQRCSNCGTLRWPFRGVCGNCRSRRSEKVAVSGEGRVLSWIVVHHPTVPTPADQLPYTVALVALSEDERIQIPAQLEADPGAITAEMAVQAVFREAPNGRGVLHWAPRDEERP